MENIQIFLPHGLFAFTQNLLVRQLWNIKAGKLNKLNKLPSAQRISVKTETIMTVMRDIISLFHCTQCYVTNVQTDQQMGLSTDMMKAVVRGSEWGRSTGENKRGRFVACHPSCFCNIWRPSGVNACCTCGT